MPASRESQGHTQAIANRLSKQPEFFHEINATKEQGIRQLDLEIQKGKLLIKHLL
jgi:hypothetical protein